MHLPFVSRGRFEDSQERVRELRNKVDELQHEIRRLNNNIAWRATGVQTYPDIEVLPERILKQAAALPEPQEEKEVDDSQLSMVDRARKATGSRNPRVIAEWISKQNVLDFARQSFGVPSSELPAREGKAISPREEAAIAAATKDLEQSLQPKEHTA